jgi:uncharacterized protein YlxW (UPF0749 family)
VTASPPPGPLSSQLLIDLATNPLDPGYAAAHARRGGRPPSNPRLDRVILAVGAVLVGLTLAIAYVHTHRSAPQTAKAHADLVNRVRAAQDESSRLQQQVRTLTGQLNTVRDRALSGGAPALDRSLLLAGDVAVHGPGLQVELKEPPTPSPSATAGRGGTGSIATASTLTDRDVRSVVNELWADGAEAIAVNGIRLTPTSAIRFAGEAVLVDFQPVTSPYRIDAIGNADSLATAFASSEVASRYQTLVSADGIGFAFSEHASLTLPAGTADVPRYAVPASPTAGPTR